MKIAIRADASLIIGSGHIMRCAALAETLRKHGVDIIFICREHPGHYCDWLEKQDYQVARLPAPSTPATTSTLPLYAAWLGVSPEQDCADTGKVFTDFGSVDWLIVDHYGLDAIWEQRMRRHASHILAIDDLADRDHDCDLLLDQNLQNTPHRYRRHLPVSALTLLGPRYALLRSEFANARQYPKRRTGKNCRLLIFFGASDPHRLTLPILRELVTSDPDTLIDVVVGHANPDRNKIKLLTTQFANVQMHIQTSHMAELMTAADLMLGAAGSTAWESCALGLPSILLCTAENQRSVGIELGRRRAALFLGDSDATNLQRLTILANQMFLHPRLLERLARRSFALVDGLGCSRLAALLAGDYCTTPEFLFLRPAETEDRQFAFAVRNDPKVYAHFFTPKPVAWGEHCAWFDAALTSPLRRLLIIEQQEDKVGVLRLDLEGDYAEISISLLPDRTKRGLGTASLRLAATWTHRWLPEIKRLIARVAPTNIASAKAFLKADYQEHCQVFICDLAP